MPRRLIRLTLLLAMILSGEARALGLGEVRLDSALNEPLIAQIDLLSVTPEELESLTVSMASSEVFERYDLDRPAYLQDIRFEVVPTSGGAYVRLRSSMPITEPFLTFLVEASWSSGRLLREYTVLLDPPTFAPPTSAAPAVRAPERSTPADSGRFERTPEPVREETPEPQPAAPPVRSQPVTRSETPAASSGSDVPAERVPSDFSAASGSYTVARGDTLWGIATALRPDSGLTMNQTMLALYEANPGAFGGNINNLREGATLRLPSADEIYAIDRGSARAEVERQHEAWGGPGSMTRPSAVDTSPTLTLVPPDEEPASGLTTDEPAVDAEPVSREQQILDEIAEIEESELPEEPALIQLRNDALAALERELAEIRGVPYEPPIIEPPVEEPTEVEPDPFVPDETATGEDGTEPATAEPAPAEPAADDSTRDRPTPVSTPAPEPSLVDQILDYATGTIGMIVGGVLLLVGGALFWFLRRGRDSDGVESWEAPLDSDVSSSDTVVTDLSQTESLRAPTPDDDAFVVVEQTPGAGEETVETEVMDFLPTTDDEPTEVMDEEPAAEASLSEALTNQTAVNLDESDPIAEADFHMAYGLYDQAADLINGALEVEPERTDLLTKLCETYFVWGNRDSFIDAAERLRAAVGDGGSEEWDKIVIMGQQIAADHPLFTGAGVAAATRAVDLTFDSGSDDEGDALDMDFGAGSDPDDFGAATTTSVDDGVDFLFDSVDDDEAGEEPTVETPALGADDTVEQDFNAEGGTAELPAMDTGDDGSLSDMTAEIEVDDLGLDLSGLDDEDASRDDSLEDDDAVDFALTQADEDVDDSLAETGKNPAFDPEATDHATGTPDIDVSVDVGDDLSPTSEMRLAADETGQLPTLNPADDESLLDATGKTQILDDDFDIQTIVGEDEDDAASALGDEDATMLATDLDDDDFDFAKTEALSAEQFAADTELEETGELPAVASTDVDLDLENLTAALQVSEFGETVEQPADDATVEQPRDDETVEQPAPFDSEQTSLTQALSPDDIDGQLHEARTMTEVGTKLDLARAYVDMGDPAGAKSILEEVLEEGDEGQQQQAQQLLDSL